MPRRQKNISAQNPISKRLRLQNITKVSLPYFEVAALGLRVFHCTLAVLLASTSSFAMVDTKNANYAETFLDLEFNGAGYNLAVRRTYNSRSLHDGIFGFGMCSDFESKLDITAEGNLRLTECGGGLEILYTPRKFNAKEIHAIAQKIVTAHKKKYRKDSQFYARLTKKLRSDDDLRTSLAKDLGISSSIKSGTRFHANGREWENIVYKNGEYTRTLSDSSFQKFNSQGEIIAHYDRNGNYLKFTHKKGKLVKAQDNKGRSLVFEYGNEDKVKIIKSPSGAKVKYTYKNGNLIQVIDAWGRTYSYQYDDLHNVTKVIYPDKKSKRLIYNKDRDWVVKLVDRENCIESYNYRPSKDDPVDHYSTTVEKRCGKKVTNRSHYEFWHKDRADKTGKYLHRVYSNINGEITDIYYHPVFGKPVYMKKNNFVTRYDYDGEGNIEKKKEGNLLHAYEYKNEFKKVSKISTFAIDPKTKKKKFQKLTEFKYNNKGNLHLAKNSEGQTVELKRDSSGRIEVMTDQSKREVRLIYDDKTNLPKAVVQDGQDKMLLHYHPNGEIKRLESPRGPATAVKIGNTFRTYLDLIGPASDQQI